LGMSFRGIRQLAIATLAKALEVPAAELVDRVESNFDWFI